MTDEKLAGEGLSRSCESLISLANAEFQTAHGMTNDDMEELKRFIRQNYDSIAPSVRLTNKTFFKQSIVIETA